MNKIIKTGLSILITAMGLNSCASTEEKIKKKNFIKKEEVKEKRKKTIPVTKINDKPNDIIIKYNRYPKKIKYFDYSRFLSEFALWNEHGSLAGKAKAHLDSILPYDQLQIWSSKKDISEEHIIEKLIFWKKKVSSIDFEIMTNISGTKSKYPMFSALYERNWKVANWLVENNTPIRTHSKYLPKELTPITKKLYQNIMNTNSFIYLDSFVEFHLLPNNKLNEEFYNYFIIENNYTPIIKSFLNKYISNKNIDKKIFMEAFNIYKNQNQNINNFNTKLASKTNNPDILSFLLNQDNRNIKYSNKELKRLTSNAYDYRNYELLNSLKNDVDYTKIDSNTFEELIKIVVEEDWGLFYDAYKGKSASELITPLNAPEKGKITEALLNISTEFLLKLISSTKNHIDTINLNKLVKSIIHYKIETDKLSEEYKKVYQFNTRISQIINIYLNNNESFDILNFEDLLKNDSFDKNTMKLLQKKELKFTNLDENNINKLFEDILSLTPYYAHYDFTLEHTNNLLEIFKSHNLTLDLSKRIKYILDVKYNPKSHAGNYRDEVYERIAKVLKLFSNYIPDINIKSDSGKTFLIWAAEHNKYKFAEYIINKGIDTKIINNAGYNAFDIAENANNTAMKRLIKSGVSGKQTGIDKLLAKKTTNPNYNSFALIIGVNKYLNETPVEYADNSAKSFGLLAQNVLGIPKENIIMLTNEKATSGQIKSNIQLITQLLEEGNKLYFFYAGHGVPGKSGETYILPSDMKADNIELESQLSIKNIYKTFASSPAKEVLIFMDSCFSGKDDSGSLLYKGVAPILKTKKNIIDKNKLSIFSAGSSSDFANQYIDEEQRLFSYYLIKGILEGKNNSNELSNYVKVNVKRKSLRLGLSYKQIPQYEGKENLIIH